MQWSPDKVEMLTRLWANGFTAREIAGRLGGNCTRNSVIGKAHRLNLHRGTDVPPREPETRTVEREEPVVHRFRPGIEAWMCRWPSDGPGRHGLNICGKTVQPGRAYCAEHCTQAYLRKRHATTAA